MRWAEWGRDGAGLVGEGREGGADAATRGRGEGGGMTKVE